jgi:asparagine synthase (glutamine-hydrolysing)
MTKGLLAWITGTHPPKFGASSLPETHYACQVLCRGYIAQRKDLATDLLGAADASTASDAQVFAAAYRRWGAALQEHVLGEYCVAVFDERRQCLFAASDALGLRPLFYTTSGERFALASHLDALAEWTGDREVDEEYVGDFLAWGQHFGCRTIFRGIRRLAGGHSLRWTAGGLAEFRTWSLEKVQPVRYRTETEYDEHFRELLSQGIRSASGEKTWAELSGGLDSSSVICTAVEAGVADLQAVSFVYPQSRTADEREWMEAVISKYSLPWHVLDGDAAQPFSAVTDRFVPEPSRAIIVWRLFREYEKLIEHHGVNVVLSGLGGDHVLFGDAPPPVHIADHFFHFDVRGALRELGRWQRRDPRQRSFAYWLIKCGARPLMRYILGHSIHYDRQSLGVCPWLDRGFVDRLHLSVARVPSPTPKMPSIDGQYFYELVSRISLSAGQFWNQLVRTFAICYPLLYRPLVEFMYALPSDQQIRPGLDRVLQRRALQRFLPAKTFTRANKKGPDESFFEGLRKNREMYSLLTERPHIVERGYVDGAGWRNAVSTARFGRVPSIPCFLSACSLEIWLRQID